MASRLDASRDVVVEKMWGSMLLDGVVRLRNGSVALSVVVDISVRAWCIVMCRDGVV